ncbi:MAG: hypothetical protein ACYTGJ_06070 [Planctomycetota bacterium]|jgi:hypothetical protein
MSPANLLKEPICKWGRKAIEKNLELLSADVVAAPRFICSKCGRAAAQKKNLCKAKKLPY